jgi:uncharacterized protein YndB with AHSA1/START domain
MAKRNEFVFTRVFGAPRKLVFKAWGEPARLAQWWGPKGTDIEIKKLEFRPGGIFHYSMNFREQKMWGKFVYREIVEPERIVFISSFADEDGNIIPSPMLQPWPLEVINTVTFVENDGKTTLSLRGGPINATGEECSKFEQMHKSMAQGFGGTFDQLAEYLQEIKD